jgi:hypothetical protein
VFGEVERRIKAAVYTPIAPRAATARVTPDPVFYRGRREGREKRLRPGERWSDKVFDCAWFLFTGTVPASAAEQDVVLLIDIEVVKIWVEGGANDLFGQRQDNGKLKEAGVALRHPQLHALQCEGAGRDLRLDRRPFEILTLRLLPMGQ